MRLLAVWYSVLKLKQILRRAQTVFPALDLCCKASYSAVQWKLECENVLWPSRSLLWLGHFHVWQPLSSALADALLKAHIIKLCELWLLGVWVPWEAHVPEGLKRRAQLRRIRTRGYRQIVQSRSLVHSRGPLHLFKSSKHSQPS